VEATVKRLSVVTTIGMFLVLIMGATVTSTGSGEGCGRSWPLCHGEFIPTYTVETLIEYSHRTVSGAVGLLVAALAIGAWPFRRRHREIRVLAPLMVGSVIIQAGMGAWAVRSPQASAVLALHFGISLIAVASVYLTMRVLHGAGRATAADARPLPSGYLWAVWGALLAVYVVAYSGAYVRHTGAELACATWPLCNGDVFPGFAGPEGVAFAHRLAALGSVVLVAALAVWSSRFRAARPDLYWANAAAFGLIVLQALSGAAVVVSRVSLFSTLAHAGLMALLFVVLCEGCRHGLPGLRPAPTRRSAAPTASVGAR
jgi:cytochrome c oxidase assembly protein subunit 15